MRLLVLVLITAFALGFSLVWMDRFAAKWSAGQDSRHQAEVEALRAELDHERDWASHLSRRLGEREAAKQQQQEQQQRH